MKASGAVWLLRTLRIVAAKDSGEFRQAVFADLASHNRSVRIARRAYGILGTGWLSSMYVAAYGVKSYLAVRVPRRPSPVWSIAAYRNERRQFLWVDSLLRPGARSEVDISRNALFSLQAWRACVTGVLHPGDVGKAFRIVRRVNRRGNFLLSCRVASALGYYLRLAGELHRTRPGAVLVSTDSNPYGLALAFAGKSIGVPSMFITHGHVPDGAPRLFFDLSMLDGEALRSLYAESGPITGHVVFKGAEGERRAMQSDRLRNRPPAVGVFLSLITDWPRLGRLIADIQRVLAPRLLLIRCHPNELVRPPDAARWFGQWNNVRISYGEQVLLADGDKCDLVFAGNSSCHLTLLKYGIPTACIEGLDNVPHDFYRFLKYRMVPGYARVEDVDLEGVARFYEDPDWARRFAFFDDSYLNGPRDAAVRSVIATCVPGAVV